METAMTAAIFISRAKSSKTPYLFLYDTRVYEAGKTRELKGSQRKEKEKEKEMEMERKKKKKKDRNRKKKIS
jgi:hypothetical protein